MIPNAASSSIASPTTTRRRRKRLSMPDCRNSWQCAWPTDVRWGAMKLVIGLGNPGAEYERTRHNIGFRVLDRLANKMGWKWNERRARAMLASGMIGGEKVVLAKPITFMNRSGESVGELLRWYKLQPQDLLVVYDELDLPLGKLRLRPGGKAAGHN